MTVIIRTTMAAKAAIPITNQNGPITPKSVGAGMLVEDWNALDNVGVKPSNKEKNKNLFHKPLKMNS